MAVRPTWIGEKGLVGFLHLPDDGTARGAVLVCPSLGSEAAWAYRGLREAADRVCRLGFAVLRLDYAGTGHSGGDAEADDGADPVGDVEEAMSFLASIGLRTVGAVAFGVGSAVLSQALRERPPLECLVLWEPAASGRRWLREQGALMRISDVPGASIDGDEIPGLRPPQSLRRHLAGMETVVGPDVSRHTLVLSGAEAGGRRLAEARGAEWQEAVDTADLLFGFRLPTESAEVVAAWIGERLSACPADRLAPPPLRAEALVPVGGRPGMVRERFAGPDLGGMFGVVTEPVGGAGRDPVVFVTTASEPAVGPGRAWVRLARELALSGRTALRLDLRGFGDSPARDGQYRDTCYPPEGTGDVIEAVRAVTGGETSHADVVGMCSGAYYALQTALAVPLRTAVVVNPIFEVPRIMQGPQGIAAEQAAWRERLRRAAARPSVQSVRRRLGPVAWRALHALRIRTSPLSDVEAIAARGAGVLLVSGPQDAELLERRGGWLLRRSSAKGHLRYSVVPGMGHSVLSRYERQAMEAAVIDDLVGRSRAGAVMAEPTTG